MDKKKVNININNEDGIQPGTKISQWLQNIYSKYIQREINEQDMLLADIEIEKSKITKILNLEENQFGKSRLIRFTSCLGGFIRQITDNYSIIQ